MEQKWLSLEGICAVLGTSPKHVQWLVKNGYIEQLPGRSNQLRERRYLDPTPEYAQRLRISETIYGRRHILSPEFGNLSEKALYSIREMAEILGWTLPYARKYAREQKLRGVKVKNFWLYSADTIRGLLWARTGKSQARTRCPVMIPELVEFFMKHLEDAPTDAQFQADDTLRRGLEKIAEMPIHARDAAMREFWGKVSIAQTAAASLSSSSPAKT